jgi:hypothetical protein
MCTAVWCGNAKEGDLLEDLSVDGRITCSLKTVGVDWIYLAGERDMWQALCNTVINLRYSLKWE